MEKVENLPDQNQPESVKKDEDHVGEVRKYETERAKRFEWSGSWHDTDKSGEGARILKDNRTGKDIRVKFRLSKDFGIGLAIGFVSEEEIATSIQARLEPDEDYPHNFNGLLNGPEDENRKLSNEKFLEERIEDDFANVETRRMVSKTIKQLKNGDEIVIRLRLLTDHLKHYEIEIKDTFLDATVDEDGDYEDVVTATQDVIPLYLIEDINKIGLKN